MKKVLILISILVGMPLLSFAYNYTLEEPAWVYINKAKRYFKREEEPGKALKLLQDVLAVEKTNADAHFLSAEIYLSMTSSGNDIFSVIDKSEETMYKIAIEHYEKSIQYAENLAIPAYEIEAHFRLLYCSTILKNMKKRQLLVDKILRLAATKEADSIKGRVFFELAKYYEMTGRDAKAENEYLKAFEYNYRPKLSLYARAMLYKKLAKNFPSRRGEYLSKEKQALALAERFEFEVLSEENEKINAQIKQRLEELKDINIPQGYKTPKFK